MATPVIEESAEQRSEAAVQPKKGSAILSILGISLLVAASIGALSLASGFIENWASQYETTPETAPATSPVRQQPATAPVPETLPETTAEDSDAAVDNN